MRCLRQVGMQHARELLADGAGTRSDIARRVGLHATDQLRRLLRG